MKKILTLAALLTGLLFAGCKSDIYYQDRAVKNAREYLLENAPELTIFQQDYVSFTAPVFLYDPAMTGNPGTFLTRIPGQICIAWLIPGSKDAYLVVGFSDSRMMDWSPNRLIRKQFTQPDRVFLAAIAAARGYIYSGIYNNLSVASANQVRFVDPTVLLTNFAPEPPLDANADAVAAFNESLKGKTQAALVWALPDEPGYNVVVFGFGGPDLGDWTPNSGGIYQNDELNSHVIGKFTPEKSK